jgi:hypothetical protein
MRIIKKILKRIYYFLFTPLLKHEILREIQRINQHHLEIESATQQQVADEFVKMYKMIEDIKCDRVDVKLNVTIVNELIKIHQSIEAIKHEQDKK